MAKTVWGENETQYFYSLTPSAILNSFEQASGYKTTGRCLALNSMENRVYELELEHEESPTSRKSLWQNFRIVKFYRPGRWTRAQIQEEHDFLFELISNEIPVVAPLKFNDESVFEDAETGLYFAIFLKIGGRQPDELTLDRVDQIGRLFARIHLVGQARSAQHRLRLNPITYGMDSLNFLLEHEILPPEIRDAYQDTVLEIVHASTPMFEATKFQRIHGDSHLGNILWGTEGPFVVDFDDFVMGPSVQDFWLMLPGRDRHAQDLLRRLITAYRQLKDFDHSDLRLIEPLRALRFVHFHAWIAKRWQDPAFPRAFEDFGTSVFWRIQLQDLRDQLTLIKSDNNWHIL